MKEKLDSYIDLVYHQIEMAISLDEVPIAAVAFDSDFLIAQHHNQTSLNKNTLSHSELLCIDTCCRRKNNERLTDISIICSLEPCMMCTGAIIQARIKKVYYMCRATAGLSLTDIFNNEIVKSPSKEKQLNHTPEIIFLEEHEEKITNIMKSYFENKR